MPNDIKTIDQYIMSADQNIQPKLYELKSIIETNAPDATKRISWGMATYYMDGNLIHFAIHKKHIGLYPGPQAIEHFASKLDQLGYKYSKGAIQIPINIELPKELIRDIVLYCVKLREGIIDV